MSNSGYNNKQAVPKTQKYFIKREREINEKYENLTTSTTQRILLRISSLKNSFIIFNKGHNVFSVRCVMIIQFSDA